MGSKSMQFLEQHLLNLTSKEPGTSLAGHTGKSRMKTMRAKTKALAQTQAHTGRVFSEPVAFNVFHCWHSLQKKGSQPAVFAIPNEVMFVFSFLTFQP